MKTKQYVVSVVSGPSLINNGVAKTKLKGLFAILLLSTGMTWAVTFPSLEGGVCKSITSPIMVDWQNTYLNEGLELRMRFSPGGEIKTTKSTNRNPMFLSSSHKISPPTRLTYARSSDGKFRLVEMKKDSHRCGGFLSSDNWTFSSLAKPNEWTFERQEKSGKPTISHGTLICGTEYGNRAILTGQQLMAMALAYKKTAIIEWRMQDGGVAELSSKSSQKINDGLSATNFYSLKITKPNGDIERTYPAEDKGIPDEAVDNSVSWQQAIRKVTLANTTVNNTLTKEEEATELTATSELPTCGVTIDGKVADKDD